MILSQTLNNLSKLQLLKPKVRVTKLVKKLLEIQTYQQVPQVLHESVSRSTGVVKLVCRTSG